LVVDDSYTIRQLLSLTLTRARYRVVQAKDGLDALEKLQNGLDCSLAILDIEMPRMDGITFLRKIMSQHPIPVVIINGGNDKEASKALEYGAAEVVSKNMLGGTFITEESRTKICDIIKTAARSKLNRKHTIEVPAVSSKLSADVVLPLTKSKNPIQFSDKVIAVGASTGGTEAIRVFLEALPVSSPGIVIVQHMPENFTRSFAERLNELCKITVKEAEDGDLIIPGRALIAPGNQHILLKRRGTQYYVELNSGPLVNRHRPAVDVLFRSVAIYAGKNAIGILLTGMGDDGAKGLLEMKGAGATTIAQDESSCVVFGMPKEAILLNAASKVLPLSEISNDVMLLTSAREAFRLKKAATR